MRKKQKGNLTPASPTAPFSNALIYALTSIDLSQCGGPMGTECTTTNWIRYFTSVERAKKVAKQNYRKESRKRRAKIRWKKEGNDWTSGDLLFVMYNIFPIKVES